MYLAGEGDVVGLVLDGRRSPDQSDGRLGDVTSAQLRDARHDWRERETTTKFTFKINTFTDILL